MMDVFIRQDLWNNSVKTPYKTGCDLVGRVINVGIDADENIHVGDLVCSLGLSIGGNAKYAIIPSSRVFVCPEDIHPTITACLVRNYMAAYQCLHRAGGKKIKAGHRVLVIGGAGAFGQACIQLAIAAGAEMVYATGKSDRSKIIIESLGAQSLGRSPHEWLPKVKGKMDIVIDSVCSDRFRSSHRALNSSGKLVCVGSTAVLLGGGGNSVYSGAPSSVKHDMKKLTAIMENTSVYDIFTYFESKRDCFRKDLLRLFHLCRQHEISPKVSYCITLDEVANAHEDLQMGDVADGSIVCLPFGVSPDAVEVNKHQNDSDAVVTEYSDGVKMRLNVTTKAMAIQVGRVQRDGSFKVSRVKPPEDRSDLLTFENRDDADDNYTGGRRNHRASKAGRDDSETETEIEPTDGGLNRRKDSKIKRRSSTMQTGLGLGLESPSPSFDGRTQRDHRRSSTRQTDLDSVASSYDGRKQRDHRRSSTRQMDFDSVASSYDGRKQRDHRRSSTRQMDLDSVASSYDGRKQRDHRRSSTRQMDLDSVASSYVSEGHTLNTSNNPESFFTDDEGKSLVTTDQSFVTEGDEESAAMNQQYRPKHSSSTYGGTSSAGRSVSARRSSSRRDFGHGSLNYGSDFDISPQRYSRTTQSRLPSQRPTQSNSRQPSKSNIQPRSFSRTKYDVGNNLQGGERGRSNSRVSQTRNRSKSRGREEPITRSRSQSRGPEQPRSRSQSRGRDEQQRARSRSRGPEQPRSRSQSRGRDEPQRARSRSRGPEQTTRPRSRSRGRAEQPRGRTEQPRARSRSRSTGPSVRPSSAARPRSSSRGRTSVIRGKSPARNSSSRRSLFVEQHKVGLLAKLKSRGKSRQGRNESGRVEVLRKEDNNRTMQKRRENERRELMYMEHDPEESSLFPEIEAVRSMVMLKGEEEVADEQSEVSWDGTARERRRARKEHLMHNDRPSTRSQVYVSQERPGRSQSNRRSSYARSSSRRR